MGAAHVGAERIGPPSPFATVGAYGDRCMRPASLPLIAVLLLPTAAYLVAVGIAVFGTPRARFETGDYVVAAIVGLYTLLVLVIARSRRGAARFALLTGSCLLAWVGFELAYRALGPLSVTPWVPNLNASFDVDPSIPGLGGAVNVTTNRYGLRGDERAPEEVDHSVLALGGSTTECLYVDDAKTWTQILQRNLEQELDRSVLVANAGRAGHRLFQHTFMLRHYPPAADFDWVVVLAGFNEAFWLFRGDWKKSRGAQLANTLIGYDPKAAPYKQLAAYRLIAAMLRSGRNVGEGTIQDANGLWMVRLREQRQAMLKKNVIQGLPADLDAALEQYRADLLDLVAATRENDQRLVLMTQPFLPRENLPEDLEALLYTGVVAKVGAYPTATIAAVVRRFNDVTRQVAREAGVACLDIADRLPPDTTTFYDDCHFNISGCAQVGALATEGMLPLLR